MDPEEEEEEEEVGTQCPKIHIYKVCVFLKEHHGH